MSAVLWLSAGILAAYGTRTAVAMLRYGANAELWFWTVVMFALALLSCAAAWVAKL